MSIEMKAIGMSASSDLWYVLHYRPYINHLDKTPEAGNWFDFSPCPLTCMISRTHLGSQTQAVAKQPKWVFDKKRSGNVIPYR